MAFRDFFRGDRAHDDEERYRERLRSTAEHWRERERDRRERGSDDDRGYGGVRGDADRRDWPPGSEFSETLAERYARGGEREGRGRDASGQGFSRPGQYGPYSREFQGEEEPRGYGRGYGDEYERRYRPAWGAGIRRTGDEDRNFGEDYGNRGAGSSDYGRYYPRGGYSGHESGGSAYGEGGHGWDSDRDRRGALGYGGGTQSGGSASEWGERAGGHRGKGPRGYRRSDERIREDVCESLTDDPRIDASNLEVTVENCEVILSGTVTSREEKRRAEDLAERVPGVKDVKNSVRVSTGPGADENMASPSARH